MRYRKGNFNTFLFTFFIVPKNYIFILLFKNVYMKNIYNFFD